MASITIANYVLSYLPDITTLLPGYDTSVAINGAMALYWSYIFRQDRIRPTYAPQVITATGQELPPVPLAPPVLVLDETLLTERQKVMVALRVVISIIPVIGKMFTAPMLEEASAGAGGAALAKFQNRSSLLKILFPMWQKDLETYEHAEHIFFGLLPNLPGFLLRMDSAGFGEGATRNRILPGGISLAQLIQDDLSNNYTREVGPYGQDGVLI